MEIVCLPRKPMKFFNNCETDNSNECTVYLQPPKVKIVNPRRACKSISAKIDANTTYKEFFRPPGIVFGPSRRFREVKRYGEFQFDTTTQDAYKWPVKTRSGIIQPRGQLGFVKIPIESATTQKESYADPRNFRHDLGRVSSCKKMKDENCRVRRPMESLTTTAQDFISHNKISYENPKEKSCKPRRKCLVAFKPDFTTVYRENFKSTRVEEYKRPQKRRKENRCPVVAKIDCRTEYNMNYRAPGNFIKLTKCR